MLKLIILTVIAFVSLMFFIYWLGKPIKSFNKNYLIWIHFKKVLKECEIKTGEDFAHFMSVIETHCPNSSYDEILKVWKEHKDSIKKAVKNIKGKK